MIRASLTASLLTILPAVAPAGGLDRSNQPIGLIFQDGNYAELSFASTTADVTGTGIATGTPYSNVANNFTTLSGGIKMQLSDQFSIAVLADQPFGSDVTYAGSPSTTEFGGTAAIADTFSLTALGQYKFSERFSVHGGLRYQTISGDITLSGVAYGPLNGYNVALARDDALGFVVGGAFEIPEYAMRVALTYNSEITHSLSSVETFGFGAVSFGTSTNTEIKSPASINVDFQTGINPKTLVFGSVRYAKWSSMKISPQYFDDAATDGVINGVSSGASISDLEDSVSYSLGVGRKISDNFSVSALVGYESGGADDLVSPLSPTNGNWSFGLGGRYTKDNVTLSGGIRYTMLGDARPETGTPDVARATFADNSALSIGMKLGFSF